MPDNQSVFSLEGKTILVTGASAGIGRQIAISCAEQGATLILTARRQDALRETLSFLKGEKHFFLCADLVKEQDREALVAGLPKLDGVVHCAGIGARVPCKMIGREHINSVMEINFTAPVLLQTELIKQKKISRGASVVFMASRAAHFPALGNAIYSASKGALISYAKCLALEVAGRDIRVNCICPGMVWSDLIVSQGVEDELKEAEIQYPLKRFGQPADIAPLAVYLSSDASSWMTGSCLDISGGGYGILK